MNISIDTEKAFAKAQHPLLMKTSQYNNYKRTYFNTIKARYEKPTSNVIIDGGKNQKLSKMH